MYPDEPNVNGYTFTESAIENAIDSYMEQVNKKQAFGVFGYGLLPSACLNLEKVAFTVSDMASRNLKEHQYDQFGYYADIQILKTPEGDVLRDYINQKDCPELKIAFMMSSMLPENRIIDEFTILYCVLIPTEQTPAVVDIYFRPVKAPEYINVPKDLFKKDVK